MCADIFLVWVVWLFRVDLGVPELTWNALHAKFIKV